jgi:hypothetical protein
MNDKSQNCESSDSRSDCEFIVPLLDCYHDNEIDETERLEVDKHLAHCDACRLELSNIASLVKKLATLTPAMPEIDFADLVEKRILANQNVTPLPAPAVKPENVMPFSSAKKWLAAAAAIIVLALIGFQMTPTGRHSLSVASGDLSEGQNGRFANPNSDDDLPDLKPLDTSNSQQAIQTVKPVESNRITPSHSTKIKAGDQKVATFDGVIEINQKQNLVAISDTVQSNIAEELGIKTDEDGLYAIKM